MTTLREAAQMALDALEHGLPIIEDFGGKEQLQIQHKAIAVLYEALRAALAQPEQEIESDRPHVEDDGCPTEKAVLQRFWREHQKQEPVAWMYDWYDETEDIDGVPIGGIVHDWISKDYDEAHSPTMGCHNIRPLYTTPPQREWQGLTDEEKLTIVRETDNPVDALAATEAKLKEKNGL